MKIYRLSGHYENRSIYDEQGGVVMDNHEIELLDESGQFNQFLFESMVEYFARLGILLIRCESQEDYLLTLGAAELPMSPKMLLACRAGMQLAGPANSSLRQDLMTEMSGVKMPKSKCGINALESAFVEWSGCPSRDWHGLKTFAQNVAQIKTAKMELERNA